jgi:alkylation response protein AidB-like acyl-CoA dehydrogenase
MDYALNEDQAALVEAVQAIVRDRIELPQSARLSYHYFDEQLQRSLSESGFLDAGREMGPLEAALVVIETARAPAVVEVSASALVIPQLLPKEQIEGPIALISGDRLGKAHRNLPIARHAIIDIGTDVVLLPVDAGDVIPVETILAYPYGQFKTPPKLSAGRRLGKPAVGTLRQWWRVALAAEMAGAALAAVAFTVQYVKERYVFGRPLGAFQAVQHRLAQCHQIANGMYYLALKAAWSGAPQDADLAACYSQQHVQKLMFDLHQFNGAMGVTSEHLLHFFTYRLRALQAEAGGAYGSALAIAERCWGSTASASSASSESRSQQCSNS